MSLVKSALLARTIQGVSYYNYYTDFHITVGYKFETLSTLPAPWAETSRDFIENRQNEIVNNKAQYCTVVRTGIGSTTLCLGGEVDASKQTPLLAQRHTKPPYPLTFRKLIHTACAIRNKRK